MKKRSYIVVLLAMFICIVGGVLKASPVSTNMPVIAVINIPVPAEVQPDNIHQGKLDTPARSYDGKNTPCISHWVQSKEEWEEIKKTGKANGRKLLLTGKKVELLTDTEAFGPVKIVNQHVVDVPLMLLVDGEERVWDSTGVWDDFTKVYKQDWRPKGYLPNGSWRILIKDDAENPHKVFEVDQ